MMLYSVNDSNFPNVLKTHYDLGVFACGYEQRCVNVATFMDKSRILQNVVFGFKEIMCSEQRKKNDEYFIEHWNKKQILVSTNDEGPIYNYFLDFFKNKKGNSFKIMVDYSSMSRLWYSGILHFLHVAQTNYKEIIVDLLYSVGAHRKKIPEIVITDILSIPGFEGISVPFNKSVAVFGLGFDRHAPLCVLDRLESDIVYAFLAAPAAFDDYPRIARDNNKELIEAAKKTLEFPLNSVEHTYRYLTEIVTPHFVDSNIILIPMGPKPHVLASILLSMRFDSIACLRVTGNRSDSENVQATGDIVVTRIHFRNSMK